MGANQPPDNSDGAARKAGEADFREQLLGSLNKRRGRKTEEWLAKVTQYGTQQQPDSTKPVAQADPPPAAGDLWQTAVKWVDHIFDCFGQYQFDFNQQVNVPELKVETDRPQIFAGSGKDPVTGEAVHYFRGRLFTRMWTLLLKAQQDLIDGYVVPNEMAIRFTANPGEFRRFMIAKVEMRGDKPTLLFDGQCISWEDTPALSRELFGYLVTIAEGVAGPDHVFRFSRDGRDRIQVEETILDLPPHLATALEENFLSTPSSGATAPEPPAPAPGGQLSLEAAFDQVSAAFDRELKLLADAGSQAFAKQDTAAAERVLKRTGKLKALRQEVLATMSRWQDALKDES